MSVKNIGDIARKLESCVKARSAIDHAVRVYEDVKILVYIAAHAVSEAEQIFKDSAEAVEAATEAKIKAVIALEAGMLGLIESIKNAKNIKRSNALDTCLAAREAINFTAQKVDALKRSAESTFEVASLADAALSNAQSALIEYQRIYDNAVANAVAAQNDILEASKILSE